MVAGSIETTIGGLFTNLFGNPLMIGLIGLLMFIVFAVALRLSFELSIILIFVIVAIASIFGLLPKAFLYGLIIIGSLIIFIAISRLMARR